MSSLNVSTPPATDKYELPAAIAAFAGEINDIDAHEATPANLWVERFGERAGFMSDAMYASNPGNRARNKRGFILGAERYTDDTPINSHTVWHEKTEMAPGAWEMDRRLDVLDFIGTRRQIMYPGSMALRSLTIHARAHDKTFFASITGDRRALAKGAIDAYNDWVMRQSNDTDRLRPVAVLLEDSLDDLIATAKKMINKGVRGVMMPTGRPPGGMSPAHEALDPLWDLLSSSKTPLFSHIGTDEDYARTLVWREAEAFKGWKVGEEFPFDPWTLSTIHMGVQNFITCMVQGGVFERFPELYMSCNEYGAHWLGPLAENMDMWVDNQPFPNDKGFSYLKMKPSEYLRRNVRVAPWYFEDVGAHIARFGLEECYCYGSDYPHHEGGKDPIGNLTLSLQKHGFGEETMRKFFVENAKVILPN